MHVDKDLSERAGRAIGTAAKQCYYNAYRALHDLPELADGTYTEGYAVIEGQGSNLPLVIEHGWLELDGRIVDPTLGGNPRVLSYWPGLRFTLPELDKAILTIPKSTAEDLPIFYRLGWGGEDSPDMMTAAALAYDAAGSTWQAQRYRDAAQKASDRAAGTGRPTGISWA